MSSESFEPVGLGRYCKKPVEIEAVQLTTIFGMTNLPAVVKWIRGHGGAADEIIDVVDHYIEIYTLEGVMRADIGDWIIRGIEGEFYPCKPTVFANSYEGSAE